MARTISLNNGLEAIVDDEDYERVTSSHHWYAARHSHVWYVRARTAYAVVDGRKKYKEYSLHRVVMGATHGDGTIVDHINRNPLDNRKSNLRITNHFGNAQNRSPLKNTTSIYKGVSLRSNGPTWRAILRHNGQYIHKASYATEREAALAYDYYARITFGEPAYLNFPDECSPCPPVPLSSTSRSLKNKHGYKGVHQYSKYRYYAIIGPGGRDRLGSFDSAEDAARAYDREALNRYGPTTYLNFPDEILPKTAE